LPTSYMEQPTPQGLWATLQSQCLDGLPGCDVLAIPHNPNASGGLMFAPVNADGSPLTAADAAFRSSMEPLVEMNQHKGDSECRPGVQSTDEICGFEKLNRLQLFSPVSDPNQVFPPLSYVRNALKEGLVQEQRLGVNPFKLGLIGSTDTHNSTPGATEEQDFGAYGHIGLRDHATPAFMLARVTPAGIEATPGGLAVVWAEENSRDALFAAIRRREVYGTSGTRPILRFFGGREANLRCRDPDFAATAYAGGVPMGGEIGPVRGGRSPRFGVLAFRDPGTPTAPGTPLQRVQIVKGWVDAGGQSHEKVFDVAGNPDNGAGVNTATCTPSGTGFDSLCAGDGVYRVTVPAGTLRQVRPGRSVWNDATGSIGGIRSLRLRQRGHRSVFFRLRTVPLGLSAADRVDHFIEVSLRADTAAVTTTPLWHFDGTSLVTRD